MLEKPLFDCSKLGDFYDCGCADDEHEGEQQEQTTSKEQHVDREHDVRKDGTVPVEISKEPYAFAFICPLALLALTLTNS